MDLTDTHCHIHEAQAATDPNNPTHQRWVKNGRDPDDMITAAHQAGVTCLICVGTTLADSQLAVDFVQQRHNTWASIGLHPHEAKDYAASASALQQFAALVTRPKIVAVGECGLDYYYNHSPKGDQEKILRFQIELALQHNLPLIFHVRDAFADFWPIFDSYPDIRGVIHSFSAGRNELEQILQRNLYLGLNGIMTFTKDPEQIAAAKAVPANRLLLETDAPFLTPAPQRATICEPKHARLTAEFLSQLRGETLADLADYSTANARALFTFDKRLY
ncbi:MAG TPA: TatD family hydrolase [Nevskiaceae bacterium]|nr:TatD family hydrolase [Nevskiaceae bacterium]